MNKIFKSISQIMLDMDAIGKNNKNAAQGWKFRGIDDVYNSLQKIMATNGVISVPALIEIIESSPIKSTKGAEGFRFVARYTFRFYAEDGSYIDAVSIGEAIDYGDKAANKSASIAHKYALIETFCIPTLDDKDPDAHVHIIENRASDKICPSSEVKQPALIDEPAEFTFKYLKQIAGRRPKDVDTKTLMGQLDWWGKQQVKPGSPLEMELKIADKELKSRKG